MRYFPDRPDRARSGMLAATVSGGENDSGTKEWERPTVRSTERPVGESRTRGGAGTQERGRRRTPVISRQDVPDAAEDESPAA